MFMGLPLLMSHQEKLSSIFSLRRGCACGPTDPHVHLHSSSVDGIICLWHWSALAKGLGKGSSCMFWLLIYECAAQWEPPAAKHPQQLNFSALFVSQRGWASYCRFKLSTKQQDVNQEIWIAQLYRDNVCVCWLPKPQHLDYSLSDIEKNHTSAETEWYWD